MVKLILDGALLAECDIVGKNGQGMLRIAEEVTKNIIQNNNFDLAFANTVYSKKHVHHLQKYIQNNYPDLLNKILSKDAFLSTYSAIPAITKFLRLSSEYLNLKINIDNLNEYDLFHSFYYPFPSNIRKNKIKKSITYLDIIPLRMDGYKEMSINYTKKIIESIVPNYAISISEFSKQDLIDYDHRIDSNKIFVSPLAASKELFYQNKNKEDWKRVKKKYNFPSNYFLSITSTDLRKNIKHLIKSFRKFILQEKPNDLFLVLAGNYTNSYKLLDDLKIEKEVRDLIFIPDQFIENQDLAIIYSNAVAFFFMSTYEGFGLPALEAMQCGTPVVTSNTTSLPEVVGDSGIMINPLDEELLCETMNNIYNNTDLREKYINLGLKRAELFSWEKCSNDYMNIINTIATK